MTQIRSESFIGAEPALLDNGKIPAVILSFGETEGPVEDKFISVNDARQLVLDVLNSLATMGDETAQAIGEQFFKEDQQL